MNNKYIIKKDELYIGEVVEPSEYYLSKEGKYLVSWYHPVRGMIYKKDGYNAQDLLHHTSNTYPIVSMYKDDSFIKNKYVIAQHKKLNEIIDYLGFSDELTKNDLIKLKNIISDINFTKENPYLFGVPIDDENAEAKRIKYNEESIYDLKSTIFFEHFANESGSWLLNPFFDKFKPTYNEKNHILKLK